MTLDLTKYRSQALYTASFVIQQCDATTYGNPVLPINLDIASNWLYAVSMILFLATALLPICAQLYRSQESIAFQRLKWAHVVILVVFAALYISSTAYLTWIIETPDYDDFYFTSYYAVPFRQIIFERLAAARSFIQGIAALVAGSTIIGAWNISRRQGSRSTGLLIGTIIFMLALFVDSIGTFGLYIAEMVTAINGTDSSLSYTGESAAFIVFNVLELIAWAALLVVACSQAMGQSSFNGDKPYQYAPAPFHSGNAAPEVMVMNTEYQPHTVFGPQQTSYDSAGPRQDYQMQQQQQTRDSMRVSPVSPQAGQQQQYQAYTPQTGAGQQHAY